MYRAVGKIYTITPGDIIIQGVPVKVDPIQLDVPVEQAATDMIAQVKPHADELLGNASTLINQKVDSVKTWAVLAGAGLLVGLYFILRLGRK